MLSSFAMTPTSTTPSIGRDSPSFSNAGQRCAAASRIIVFDAVYDEFVAMFVEATRGLKLGVEDDCRRRSGHKSATIGKHERLY